MKAISRKEALEISAGILEQAERERIEFAEYESERGVSYEKDVETKLDCL